MGLCLIFLQSRFTHVEGLKIRVDDCLNSQGQLVAMSVVWLEKEFGDKSINGLVAEMKIDGDLQTNSFQRLAL